MKKLVFACMVITFLTACPSPDPVEEPVDISQVQLSSLVEIRADEARAMVTNVTSKGTICGNASADVSTTELKQLISARGVSGMKLIRANHTAEDKVEELRNRPTIIIAIFVNKEVKFYKPVKVCPPPDGSVCLDGLQLLQTTTD